MNIYVHTHTLYPFFRLITLISDRWWAGEGWWSLVMGNGEMTIVIGGEERWEAMGIGLIFVSVETRK